MNAKGLLYRLLMCEGQEVTGRATVTYMRMAIQSIRLVAPFLSMSNHVLPSVPQNCTHNSVTEHLVSKIAYRFCIIASLQFEVFHEIVINQIRIKNNSNYSFAY